MIESVGIIGAQLIGAAVGLYIACHLDCYGRWHGPTPRSILNALRKRR